VNVTMMVINIKMTYLMIIMHVSSAPMEFSLQVELMNEF